MRRPLPLRMQVEGAFVQGLGMMLSESAEYLPAGLGGGCATNSTWWVGGGGGGGAPASGPPCPCLWAQHIQLRLFVSFLCSHTFAHGSIDGGAHFAPAMRARVPSAGPNSPVRAAQWTPPPRRFTPLCRALRAPASVRVAACARTCARFPPPPVASAPAGVPPSRNTPFTVSCSCSCGFRRRSYKVPSATCAPQQLNVYLMDKAPLASQVGGR